jgi:hypothetical protein
MGQRSRDYACGDAEFEAWLNKVDALVEARIGLSLFDLEDMMLRYDFDQGLTPKECFQTTVADMLRDNYGTMSEED